MKKKNKKPNKKSSIILPDSKIVIPGKQPKPVETISTMIQIPFVFNTASSMDEIINHLDEVFKSERVKTINAIGELLGIKVVWEENK